MSDEKDEPLSEDEIADLRRRAAAVANACEGSAVDMAEGVLGLLATLDARDTEPRQLQCRINDRYGDLLAAMHGTPEYSASIRTDDGDRMGILIAGVERLRAEAAADRAAVRALVEALPRCHACGKPATWSQPNAPDIDTGERGDPAMQCDEHRGEDCPRKCCTPVEVAWAGAFRALVARVATWPSPATRSEGDGCAIPADDPLWQAVMRAPLATGPIPEAERVAVEAAKADGRFVDGATVSAEIARRKEAEEKAG